jgi:hypothetical protein
MDTATPRAKDRPLFSDPTDYEDDVSAWCFEQAEVLRQRRFSELDLLNVIEEIESLGNEQEHALESQYSRLILHLLKWTHQAERRGSSWRISIRNARFELGRRERRNPSLAARASQIVTEVYQVARANAADETGLPLDAFPATCPFTLDQLRDENWLPE